MEGLAERSTAQSSSTGSSDSQFRDISHEKASHSVISTGKTTKNTMSMATRKRTYKNKYFFVDHHPDNSIRVFRPFDPARVNTLEEIIL